jgi:hypothetical protein
MGNKMFPYNPSTNNCQDFILSVLKANGINDENAFSFVKQDTSMIFKNKGWLSSLAKNVTDLGGYSDVILQGGSLKKGISNDLTKADPYRSQKRDPEKRLQVDQAEDFLHRFWQKKFEILQPETRPRFRLQNLRRKRSNSTMKPTRNGGMTLRGYRLR